MIRYGKRLAKRTIFDYAQCRDENKYTDFVIADLCRQLEERMEEIEAKDAELDEASEPKTCGAYRIVNEDEYAELRRAANIGRAKEELYFRTMDAKDAEINTLGFALMMAKRDGLQAREEAVAEIVAVKDSEIAAVAHESEVRQAEVVRQRDEAKAELRKLQRLHCGDSTYDANAVNGFSESAACSLVGLAMKILEDNGGKVPFSAACAVVLKRELDKAKEANRVLGEKNAELAKKAQLPFGWPPTPEPYFIKGQLINHTGCITGRGPQTITLKNCEVVSKKNDSHAKDEHGCYTNSVFDPCANGDNGK